MKIEQFLQRCIATPAAANIRQSIKFLQSLGALDENESLTLLGSHLAEMPVDAQYGKILIYGILLRCLNPVLSIVSILSMGDQIFVLPIKPADRFKCHQIRRTLASDSHSDHFVMLKIFELWTSMKKNGMNERRFCEDNFISANSMEMVRGIQRQITSYLQTSGFLKATDLNVNSWKWSTIKACLCAGLYPNVARIDRKKKAMYSDIDRKLVFHVSSVLSNKNDRSMDFVKGFPADWVVFEEKNRVGRTSLIRCNTLINSFGLSLTAGAALKEKEEDDDWTDEEEENDPQIVFKIDSLVTFITDRENGALIFHLRRKLDELLTRFLISRNFTSEKCDDVLIKTIARALDIEERNSGFEKVNIEVKEELEALQRNAMTRGNQMNRQQPNGNQWRSNCQSFGSASSQPPNSSKNRGQSGNKLPAAMPSNRSQPLPPPTSHIWGQPLAPPTSNNRGRPMAPPSSNNRKSYFVMKMNSVRLLNDLASRVVFDVDLLDLHPAFLQKLNHPMMVSLRFKRFKLFIKVLSHFS